VRVLLLGLGAAALLVLLGEGVLSLALGRSWRDWFTPSAAPLPDLELEREQAVAARATEGPFRVPEDPLVSYTLKLESQLDFVENKVSMVLHTDELGLRARATPAAASTDALRIVVLGDSVAFGYGLADGDVLAAQLEQQLAAALPGRSVVCETVALPSWNCRNAWRFLFDHLERFRPALVLYLPVDNDLEDGFGVNEAGQRRISPDLAVPQPLLPVHANWTRLRRRIEELRAAGEPEPRLGPEVLAAGMSTTSRWRLTDMARTLAHGKQRLARTGARLALVFYEESDFQKELLAELARQDLELPQIPLLERVQSDDTLGIDPHPSAETTAAFATWIAQALFELGWLPEGERAPLPAVADRYAERRARPLAPEQALAWSVARRAALEDELEPRIVPATLQGMLQIYGGLNLDASVGTRLAAVLRRGQRLSVRLEALAARPDLYPLEVGVVVNERLLGTLLVPPGGTGEAEFELSPAEVQSAFEVRLEPRDWVVVKLAGRSVVAAARLLELESRP
jgi:lysophospholipase L1-like esterase